MTYLRQRQVNDLNKFPAFYAKRYPIFTYYHQCILILDDVQTDRQVTLCI